ncbi:hypothetical protein [Brevundimonas diminuta]|uniref:hypothetical protein n=1 Tax=Brevundimonas diminuta TaxID=293 RepID=UPI001F569CD4|nr:hypothetical protein [Brevundimonas diminuta]
MTSNLIGLVAALGLAFAAAAPASAQQAATIEARTAPGGVLVTWKLAQPTTEVAFVDQDIIRTLWTVKTPGLSLSDGVVKSDQPFDAFEILIAPDAAEVDRVYIGLVRVGSGQSLYGPALALKDMDAELTVRAAAGETVTPQSNAIQSYVYVGPTSAVTQDDGGVVVVGDTVPASLRTTMSEGFLAAQGFYGARLGRDLPYAPTLIVTTDSPGPTTYRGDVTDNGVISLRFHGSDWSAPPPDVIEQLSTFVWHETLHLWNSHAVTTKDGASAPWLHEGGAEYGALIAALSTGTIDEAQLKTSLARRLNGCRAALGDRPDAEQRLRTGNAIYHCGVVVQWIADLESRRASDGRKDIFDIWKAMLQSGRAGDGYGVADFRSRLTPDTAVAVLLDGPGPERWTGIQTRLSALGVTLVNRPSPRDLRQAALFHMVDQNCGGEGGFSIDNGRIKLDSGDRCGALSGDPVVVAIEDLDPMSNGQSVFQAVQARCAENLPIRYTLADGKTVEAVCKAPLKAPDLWAVDAMPDLRARRT